MRGPSESGVVLDAPETLLVGLLASVAALVLISNRLGVPYPIVLTVGGVGIALVPGVSRRRSTPPPYR